MAKKIVKEIEEEVIELDGLELDDKKGSSSNIENDDYEKLTVEDRIIGIEKRTNAIFVLVIIAIIIGLLNTLVIVSRTSETTSSSNSGSSAGSSTNSGYDTSKFDTISGADIASLSKNETIVVLIARQTCSYCSLYAPIITSAQETYGFTTKYIDLTKVIDMSSSTLSITDQSSYDGLFAVTADKNCVSTVSDVSCDDFISKEFGATPLTLIIRNNKLIYAIAGYVDEATLSSHLEKAGFSK